MQRHQDDDKEHDNNTFDSPIKVNPKEESPLERNRN